MDHILKKNRYLQYKLEETQVNWRYTCVRKNKYSHPFAQLFPAPESEVRYVSGRKREPRTPLRSFFDKISLENRDESCLFFSHLVANTSLQIYLDTPWYISRSPRSCYFIKVYSGLFRGSKEQTKKKWVSQMILKEKEKRAESRLVPFQVVMGLFHGMPKLKKKGMTVKKREMRQVFCAYPRRV